MHASRKSELPLLIMIILIYSTVCMETDIYVPAFPDMKTFFKVSDEYIQRVLTWNFVGLCIGSLIFGPLSDALGRKKTMQIGLSVFALSSWGCVFFNHMDFFLICRFVQGIGAAAPMAIAFAIILDKFDTAKAAQICGILNIFITGVMAAAPILGSIVIIYFNWRFNFIIIAFLASLSVIGDFYLIEETLPPENRADLSVFQILQDYKRICTNFRYMAGTTICYLLFACLIVFIANLSLIFIEYLQVSKTHYGFYQASIMLSFALFSFISIGMIKKYGTEKTKKAGLGAVTLGSIGLLLAAYINPDPLIICATMAIYSAGVTLAAPTYSIEAANAIPQLRGVASGMNNAMRHLIIAGVVVVGGMAFNGTIIPVAVIVGLTTLCGWGLILFLPRQK